MELNGSTVIAQPKEKVWAALNNEAILQHCITGCEAMERINENSLGARLAIKLGPVRAKFNGQVSMSNIRPLEGYTLTFEGSGGAAGFAKGSSNVELTSVENGTQVSYTVNASVGGKLGQIGGRMIDAAAKGMADDFFAAFGKALEPRVDSEKPGDPLQGAIQASIDNSFESSQVATSVAATSALAGVPRTQKIAMPAANGNTSDSRLFWFCAGIACGAALLLIGKHWL
jgi:uncharacterized protein